MCTIFSGHISFGEDDWGKVYFGPTYVHHEIDRKAIPHERLLAWETEKEANFSSFIFTHDCGYDVPEKTKGTLMGLLEEWGKGQEQYVQEYLQHIAIKDKSYNVRGIATKHITDQKTLSKIATEDGHWQVRYAATTRITDQEVLANIATSDNSWNVRQNVAKHIADPKILAKMAIEDEHWLVRVAATRRITNQETLAKIAAGDKDLCVRVEAKDRINELNHN